MTYYFFYVYYDTWNPDTYHLKYNIKEIIYEEPDS